MGTIFQTFIDKSKTATNTRWLLSRLGECFIVSKWLAKGNGTNIYGKIPGGTPLGIHTSSKKAHPQGCAVTTAVTTTANTITVGAAAAKHFLVGDNVDLVDADGSTSIAANRTITAIDLTTGVITVSGATLSMDIGDIIRRDDGTETFFGFAELIDRNPRMGLYDTDDTPITADKGIKVIVAHCVVDESELPYICAPIKAQAIALGAGFRFL